MYFDKFYWILCSKITYISRFSNDFVKLIYTYIHLSPHVIARFCSIFGIKLNLPSIASNILMSLSWSLTVVKQPPHKTIISIGLLRFLLTLVCVFYLYFRHTAKEYGRTCIKYEKKSTWRFAAHVSVEKLILIFRLNDGISHGWLPKLVESIGRWRWPMMMRYNMSTFYKYVRFSLLM